MSTASRTQKSVKNIWVALVTQVFLLLASFATRSVFIATLGAEYLGMNALFVSMVAVLGLADAGMAGAMTYALYDPLSRGDLVRTRALVKFCGRIYRRVSLIVAAIGTLTIPLLPLLLKLEQPVPRAPLYFGILVMDASVGYLFIYRTILLNADQRTYVVRIYTTAILCVRSVVQIFVLLKLESYFGFLAAQLVGTAATNLLVYRATTRRYPFLRERDETSLAAPDQRHLYASVRSMLLYRVGGMILNNTDPILISVIVGTASLGFYSNYMLLVGSAMMFTDIVFTALTPSVGNLAASESVDRRRIVFNELNIVAAVGYGAMTFLVALATGPFVSLWLGPAFTLPRTVVLAMALNVYLSGIMAPVATFRTATGLFRETRYVFLITAALNVLLSIALGLAYGIAGILFATALARVCTHVWFEPLLLWRNHLHASAFPYFRKLVLLGLLNGILLLLLLVLESLSEWKEEGLGLLISSTAVSLLIPTALAWLMLGRSEEGRSLARRARALMTRT